MAENGANVRIRRLRKRPFSNLALLNGEAGNDGFGGGPNQSIVLAETYEPLTGGRELFRQAERASGAPLARALRQAGSPPVTYDRCYSPGTDFLLGRRSAVVSRTGAELTSNYVLRYGEVLKRRGEWTLVDTLPVSRDDAAAARVIVVARGGTRQPPAGTRIFEDRRFAAWLRPIH